MGWDKLAVLFLVSAICSCMGFYKYVYFISIGYGLAVAGIGVTLMIMGAGRIGLVCYALCALFILYGFRLSGFLLYREIKSASYRKTLKVVTGEYKDRGIGVKVAIWISVCILYVLQTSPAFYLTQSAIDPSWLSWAGAAISAGALALESVADWQKSNQKKERPDMVATKGLYRFVRCPNYFAEILFWTGILISGAIALTGVGQWALALVGYVSIVFIMFNGAHRLEKRQMKTYGKIAEYRKYADETPIIIPGLPIYHLNRQ